MGSIANDVHKLSLSTKEVKPTFPSGTESNTLEYAQAQDAACHMREFRDKFIIPSKENIKAKKISPPGRSLIPHLANPQFSIPCSYLFISCLHIRSKKYSNKSQASPMNLQSTSVETPLVSNQNVHVNFSSLI